MKKKSSFFSGLGLCASIPELKKKVSFREKAMRKMETRIERLIYRIRGFVRDLQEILSGPGNMGRLVP